jgi:hypothetical protein
VRFEINSEHWWIVRCPHESWMAEIEAIMRGNSAAPVLRQSCVRFNSD